MANLRKKFGPRKLPLTQGVVQDFEMGGRGKKVVVAVWGDAPSPPPQF